MPDHPLARRIRRAYHTTLATNEAEPGPRPAELYPRPSSRHPGQLAAAWGDRPALAPDGTEAVFSQGVLREAYNDGPGLLERLSAHGARAPRAARSHLRRYFRHAPAAEGASIGHVPVVHLGKEASAETLLDVVRRVVGRP